MKTVNEIDIYEIDGRETKPTDRPKLHILSHLTIGYMVVIWVDVGFGKSN